MSIGKYRKEDNCLNCGRQVQEHFCSHCGQENVELKENALHMITHAIADYFHFESKFFATIKPLLFQPGRLTEQYVSGKRVTFIHPIRLYIFISIVFFIFTLSSNDHESPVEKDAQQTDSLKAMEDKVLENTLKSVPMPGINRDSLTKALQEGNKKEKKKKKKYDYGNLIGGSNLASTDTTVAAYENRQLALPKEQRDNILDNYLAKKNIKFRNYPDASERLLKDLMHNIPKLMFILLPLFALILKLVYIRKDRYYYEHLIYSFHTHSAMFLSVLLFMLVNWASSFFYDISDFLVTAWMLYFLWYLYRSLKDFYGSTRWVTIFKMMFLFVSYTLIVALSMMSGIIFVTLMF